MRCATVNNLSQTFFRVRAARRKRPVPARAPRRVRRVAMHACAAACVARALRKEHGKTGLAPRRAHARCAAATLPQGRFACRRGARAATESFPLFFPHGVARARISCAAQAQMRKSARKKSTCGARRRDDARALRTRCADADAAEASVDDRSHMPATRSPGCRPRRPDHDASAQTYPRPDATDSGRRKRLRPHKAAGKSMRTMRRGAINVPLPPAARRTRPGSAAPPSDPRRRARS